jgi:3-oxoacyl-[acyl-carrier-protein] synthase-1
MVTGVGLNSAASCAAIRCAISNFTETRFHDDGGEWIIGCAVPLEPPWRGLTKLVHLAAPAIGECLVAAEPVKANQIPLLLCVAEKERPGRLAGQDDRLLEEIQRALGVQFHPQSAVIAEGRIGGITAVARAWQLLLDAGRPYCIVAGVDTYLVAGTLNANEAAGRLLTSKNSNGFLPGEAGAAALLGPPGRAGVTDLVCLGVGFGREEAVVGSDKPLRADGLVAAIKAASLNAGISVDEVDYRLTDLGGERYGFKEASLAWTRMRRVRVDRVELLHPADCIGAVGGASVPCVLGIALTAARKKYAPGPVVLCHFGNDTGERAALILAPPDRRSG